MMFHPATMWHMVSNADRMGMSVGVQALTAHHRCDAATGSRLKAKHQRLLTVLMLIPVRFVSDINSSPKPRTPSQVTKR